MKYSLAIFIFLCFFSNELNAQVISKTFISTTDPVKDAMVGSGGVSNHNFGNLGMLSALRNDGNTPNIFRSYIKYDFSTIPQDAVLLTAKLRLVAQSVSSSNVSLVVEKVASSWEDDEITWENQPETDISNSVVIEPPVSMSTVQEVDVYEDVYSMINSPYFNHGWCVKLKDESIVGSNYGNTYYSSESGDTALMPKLEITYMMPLKVTCTTEHCSAGLGPGDGSVSVGITGGSGQLRRLQIYKVNEVGTPARNSLALIIQLASGTTNSAAASEIGDLEPGLYLARALDLVEHTIFKNSGHYNPNVSKSLFFVIGKPGVVTSGLIRHPSFVSQTSVHRSMGTLSSDDRANTNHNRITNMNRLMVQDIGANLYDHSYYIDGRHQSISLLDLNLFIDPRIEYIDPKLILGTYSHSYQAHTSSNAMEYNLIKDEWNLNTVTWNNRPSIETAPNFQLAKGSLSQGNLVIRDEVDFSSFIDYWKNPANENYGIQIGLQDYGVYPTRAQRSYGFIYPGRSRFRFSFTVPEEIVSEFNDSTGLGSITVNAPVGDLPYTYLIGYDSIPELSEIWNGIKDSVAIDSATFFGGKVDNLSQTFPNLKNGDYYVATFDNLGTKIFEEKITVKPNFEYFNTTNIEVSEEGVISQIVTTSAASATLIASLKSNNDGGVRFKIKNIGSGIVGFNKLGDQQINALQDLEFGIEILPNGSARIYQNNVSLGTFSIAVDDRIGIYKKEKKFYIEKNEENVFESTEDDNIEEDYSLGIYMTSSQNSERLELEMELLEGLMNQILIPINETGTIFCGDFESVISIPTNFQGWNVSATVTDLLTGQIIPILSSGNQSSISIPLPVGTYSISIVLSDPNTSATVNAGVQHINVGYNILWDLPSSINHTVTSGLELKSDPFNSSGESISVNSLPGLESGFVSFKVHLYHRPFEAPPKGNSLSPITSASISMYDQGSPLNELVKVEVQGLGYNLLSRFLMITYTNGSLITDTYLTDNDNSTYKIIYDASLSNMKVFENATQKLNLPLSGITNLKVKGRTSPYSGIYNTKVSFCQNYLFNYADLTKKLDGGYYKAKEGMVKFIFNEEYNDLDNNLTYQIFDDLNQEVITNADISKSVGYGDNRYELDFKCSGSNALSNGFYVLKVTNEKNESWFLRIKITDNC